MQNQGNTDIASGLAASTGQVQGGYSAARPYYTTAYDTGRGAVDTGANAGLGYLDSGAAAGRTALGQASGAYDSLDALAKKYGAGTSTYLGALGIGTPDETAAARSAFTESPGYQYNVDSALEGINRRRAAGGMLASGNADTDAMTTASGLASQEYNTWLGNLQALVNPELSATSGAASGRAGVATNLANLETNLGQNKAATEQNRGSMLANLASTYGGQMGGSYADEGKTLAGLTQNATGQKINLATNIMQPYTNTYNTEANAQMQGAGNLWGLGMNLVTGLTGAAGKAGGFGNLFK